MEKLIIITLILGMVPALLTTMATKGRGNMIALVFIKAIAIGYLLLATIYILKQLNII